MSCSVTRIIQIFSASDPGEMLTEAVLRNDAWLPCFLADSNIIPAGPAPYHSGSVLAHTARCMSDVAGDPLAVWMSMVHDAGKLTTPKALWPHHYGHELRGASLAAEWARILKLPEEYKLAGTLSALLHMRAGRYARLRTGKKYDLLCTVAASGFFESFWKVVDADTKSSISERAMADWKRVNVLPCDGMTPERERQRAIAILTSRA